MKTPTKEDIDAIKENVNLEMSEAGRCQYCSSQCGGNNKCGSAPIKKQT